jgi:hypothetical protein
MQIVPISTITTAIVSGHLLYVRRKVINLTNKILGVQPVGNIQTYSGYGESTAASLAAPTTFYGTNLEWDSLPTPTSLTSWTPIVLLSTAPLANHSRRDCEEYEDNTEGHIPCYWMAKGVDVYDFVKWNLSLDLFNCTLTNNTRYCSLLGSGYYLSNLADDDPPEVYAEYPSNAAPNSTKECYNWYETTTGTASHLMNYAYYQVFCGP